MKRLLAVLLLLTAVVLGAWWAYQSPGFVVIGRGHWSVETSLSVFLLLLLLVFFLFYLLVQLAAGVWHLPERLHSFLDSRRQQRTHEALSAGFAALLEGQWQRAEQIFAKGNPEFLHCLGAAYAAQQRGELQQRDGYLNQALALAPDEYALATGLFQVELYRGQAQHAVALATLKQLQERAPRHPRVLQTLAELYCDMQKWGPLLELLPELRKRKALPAEALESLETQAMTGVLGEAAGQGAESLDRVWNSLPKAQRLAPRLVETYARYLLAQGRAAQAEPLLRETLRSHWDSRLVALYGGLEGDAAKQLNQAEAWLKGRESDPVLLLTLGRLCIRNRLWGKAQQYLDHSLAKTPRAETYLALGELLTQIGDSRQAAEYYRQGLAQLSGSER